MPKVTDLKAYYRDMIAGSGLDAEKQQQVLALMDDEKFAKTFTDKFKPLPDYSHDLDEVRTKTKTEKDAEYKAWYDQEMQVYNTNLAGIEKLKAYEAKYGALDADGTQQFLNEQTRGGNMLTKEDIDRMKAELKAETEAQFARRDRATLEYIDVRENHMNTFKKSLDVKAFEDAWKANPQWGGELRQAYREYVAPEMEKIRETQIKEESEKRYQEGLRDGFSRRVVPSDSQPKSFSPMFDKDVKIDKMNDSEQEQHSRSSFFEGLIEKQPA